MTFLSETASDYSRQHNGVHIDFQPRQHKRYILSQYIDTATNYMLPLADTYWLQDYYYDDRRSPLMSPPMRDVKPDDDDPIHQKIIRAAAEGHGLEGVKALLDRGADCNARDGNDLTPLHHAAFNGHERTVSALFSTGSNANAYRDMYGTPICLAEIKCKADIGDLLLQLGATVHGPAGCLGFVAHCAYLAGKVKESALACDARALEPKPRPHADLASPRV